MLADDERDKIKSKLPWFGESLPAGWLEMNDADAVFRGSVVAGEGYFSGTVSADRLDVLTNINIREGAISSYLVVGRKAERDFEIVIPAHFGGQDSVVDFDVPLVMTVPYNFDTQYEGIEPKIFVDVFVDDQHVFECRSGLKAFRAGFYQLSSYGVSFRYFHFSPITKDTRFLFQIKPSGHIIQVPGHSYITVPGYFVDFGAAGIRVR